MPITRVLRGPLTVLENRRAMVCVGLAIEEGIAARHFCADAGVSNLLDLVGAVGRPAALDCAAVASFGLAGGLLPGLRAGDIIVASAVVGDNGSFATDDVWSGQLLAAIPTAFYAPIAGVDAAVVAGAERRELSVRAGALAVDMESHIVGEIATRHQMRFVAVRVVIDTFGRKIPQAALACLSDGGETRLARLGRRLLAKPTDTLDVLRLCADWLPARQALASCSEVLGASIAQLEH